MQKAAIAITVIIAAVALAAWCALYRVVPQPESLIDGRQNRYFYGSVDAQHAKGVPYWIWLALPRIFPEYMPASGGYAALGIGWEETHEMPVGFAKQRIGYIRVTGNCALCHAIARPNGDFPPAVVPSAPGRTTDIKPLLDFYRKCAQDERFTADDILAEAGNATHLSLADRLLYRCVLIPRTRKAMLSGDAALLFGPEILEHIRDPKGHIPKMTLLR